MVQPLERVFHSRTRMERAFNEELCVRHKRSKKFYYVTHKMEFWNGYRCKAVDTGAISYIDPWNTEPWLYLHFEPEVKEIDWL